MWTKVIVGFNTEEETANFGTRACAINDVAVYEKTTLGSIQPEEQEVTESLVVGAQFHPQLGLCVQVDNVLSVFNHDCSQHLSLITCPDNVEVFTVSSCGLFLFVAAAGYLKCFHALDGREVFSKTVHQNHSNLDTFITLEVYEENECSIVLALNTGYIFRVSGFSWGRLKEAHASTSVRDELLLNLKCEKIHCVKGLQSKIIFGSSLPAEGSSLLGSPGKLCVFNHTDLQEDLALVLEEFQVKKIGGIVNNSVLLALCKDGSILQICLYTMAAYFVWKEFPVEDFIVLEGASASECALLALVSSPSNRKPASSQLVTLSWPDFKVNYRLPVENDTFLIQQKGSEEILFLEGTRNNDTVIDSIRIKSITECQPELRLERILRRCKFEEAERFATTFSLDHQIVYKAHVQHLCQELSPWSTSLENEVKIFNKILELMKKIKDDHFVAEVCVSVIPPNFNMLHTMLMYGRDRFSKVSDKTGGELSELLEKVSKISRRLDTCMLIYGSATTVTHWIKFPKYDLVVTCLNHIKRGEIDKAILVWSRHFSDMRSALNNEKAKDLLNSIPKATKLSELIIWLRHFVPSILAIIPDILMDIVQWTTQRTRDLEILDSKSWPDSGLELAKCLLCLVHTPHVEESILLQSQRRDLRNENLTHLSPLNPLLRLIDTLQDINRLKCHYSVVIQYDQFVQEDDRSFVAALLDRLPVEKVSSFMCEFFHRLMSDRSLDPDNQVLFFIQDIVMNCEDWWFWEEAPWEARVAALIPHINNIEKKLDAILHVLTTAPVPWNVTVSQLAEQGVHLPHYKASEVRNECKNVPKRLIMKKYGILVSSKHEMQLVRLILKKNLKTMLEDIAELAKCANGTEANIYSMVICHLIENGDENRALEVLKSLEKDSRMECISRLLLSIQKLFSFSSWTKLSSYLDFMPHLEDEKNLLVFEELKNVHKLKVEFLITTTFEKFRSPAYCEKILDTYANNISKDLVSGSVSESTVKDKVNRLTHLLHMTSEEGLAALASVTLSHDLLLALRFTSEIQELKNKPARVYDKVSSLIGQLFSVYNPTESSGTLVDMFTNTTNDIAKCYQTYSSDCELSDICKWVNLLSRGTVGGKTLQKLYTDPAPTAASGTLVHSSVQIIRHSLTKPTSSTINESFSASSNQISETTIERELISTWQRLREEQQDLSCIRLIFEYCWSHQVAHSTYQKNDAVDKFLVQCVKDLMRKLFRLRNFDIDLALSLLHFFPKHEALDFLLEESESVRFNYQRLSAISQLALAYNSLNKIVKNTKRFIKHFISCKWAKKLNEFGLPYKDAFKDTDIEHKQLLLKLTSLPTTTVSLLKEFCLDFRFDQQECLMMYLEYLVLNWEPDMDITVGPTSDSKVMVVKNSPFELQQQCRVILHQLGMRGAKSEVMTWSESIQNQLYNLWNKVNYYYYEVYFVLTDLYQQVLARQPVVKQINSYQTMLSFLQTYTRISSPCEAEQEQWFQTFPNTNHLPSISNYRLPFTPFFAKEPPWKILKPELSLKTYKTWYDVVPTLGLDQNMLCTLTIQRLTSKQLAGGSEKSSWRLQTCNNSVLQEIQDCVRNIHNQEMASAALYYVVNHMPPGADQMAAALLCFEQARQWLQHDNSDKAKAGFAKVHKKYLTVCTSHILHSFGLNKPDYLQLVLQPQELICALYNDPCILQRKTSTLTHCPDINQVVATIGQLHDVKILSIQQELLSEWLCPPDNPPLDVSCDDITQTIASIHNRHPLFFSDNHTIIRACYVLESIDMEIAAKLLLSYANLRDEGECRPTSVKLRALQCLCSIATPEVVLNITGRTLDSIKQNMQNLMFINELEKLGIVRSTKGFETTDKAEIVRVLLMKASPHAVQLAAAIGFIFKLTDVHYWDKILELMNSYGMVEELTLILQELTHLSHLLKCSVFTEAWNCTLITPLQKAEYPLSEESLNKVQRAVEMLYRCPIPRQVNLDLMLKHCKRLHLDNLAEQLQPFLALSHHQPLASPTLPTSNIKQEPLDR